MGMYRLLLIAQKTDLGDTEAWKARKFDPVDVCADVETALACLKTVGYHAVGAAAEEDYRRLQDALKAAGECTPAFLLPEGEEARDRTLREVRHLLHRLNVDYVDEPYSPQDMSLLVQDEMIHNLLSGSSDDTEKLRYWFEMLRSDIPIDRPCRVYLLGLPEGDLYLSDRWHHGQLRLQKALERTFFGHIDDASYCAVAFLSSVESRLLLIPSGCTDVNADMSTLDADVLRKTEEIKSYLDLNIDVYQAGTAACITDITMTNNN